MLHGHERSITQIKYNRDGDLLFSSAKDNHPCVWYSINGERLGTYEGHQGVVWAIDVDWETKHFMSGAGDNMLMIWDVQTGKKDAITVAAICNYFSVSFNTKLLFCLQAKLLAKLRLKPQFVLATSAMVAIWLFTRQTVKWVTLLRFSSLTFEWFPCLIILVQLTQSFKSPSQMPRKPHQWCGVI